MKHTYRLSRVIAATLFVLGAQPLFVTAAAQQTERVPLDSVARHLRTNPKPKKPAASSMKSSSGAQAKGKKPVPEIIVPASESPAAANTKAARETKAPPVPNERKAATKPKGKSHR